MAMRIDAWRAVGLDRIAQVDLDEHRNRHQSLAALSPMARTVLATIARRLEQDGRLQGAHAPVEGAPIERPALALAGDGGAGRQPGPPSPASFRTPPAPPLEGPPPPAPPPQPRSPP